MKQLRFFVTVGLLTSLLGWANLAQAQQEGRSEAGSASQRLVEDFGLTPGSQLANANRLNVQNLASIVQQGNANKAVANQYNPGNTVNQAFILQVGDANEANLAQQGSGNTTTIRQQGQGNQATSSVTGDNNTNEINQIGNDNRIVRDVTTDQTNVRLSLIGNNNQLRQTGTQSLAPPRYEVEMRGNGIQLSIENGRIGQ